MLGIVQDFVSLFKSSPVAIDNNVFKFHYKLSVALLIIFSIFVSTRQYFGDPIDCSKIPQSGYDDFVDTYCWFNSFIRVRNSGMLLEKI
jgi:hypothetical protein